MKALIGKTLSLSVMACVTLASAKAAALANCEAAVWVDGSADPQATDDLTSDQVSALGEEIAAQRERGLTFGAKGSVVGRMVSLWFTTDQAEAKEEKGKKHSKHKSKKHASKSDEASDEDFGAGSDFNSEAGSEDNAELGSGDIDKLLATRSRSKSASTKKVVGRGNPALESIRNGTATDVNANDADADADDFGANGELAGANGLNAEESAANRDILVSLMRHQREPRFDPLQPLSGRWVRCREVTGTPNVRSIRDRFSSSDKSHFTHTISSASDVACNSVVSEERTNYECTPMNSELLTCHSLKRETKVGDGPWSAAKDFVSSKVKLNYVSGVKKYARQSKRRSKKARSESPDSSGNLTTDTVATNSSSGASTQTPGTVSATTMSASAITAPSVSTEAIAAMVGRKADTRKIEIKLLPESGEAETYVLHFAPLKSTR